jgi:hypothetical protein
VVSVNNSINNTVGASNAGATNTLTIQNPSNTASSTALTISTVGGNTAYGAYNRWVSGTAESWAMGIVNNLQGGQPQNFVLAAAASATADISSSTFFMTCDVPQRKIGLFDAIAFSTPTSDFSLQKSKVNTPISIGVINADTTGTSSDAWIVLSSGNGGSGASVLYLATNTGGNNFYVARTNTNVLQMGASAVGLQMTSAGVVTLPAAPLPVGSGGLGITTTPSNGQIPIGNGTTYAAANITSTGGTVTVTNGSGTINLESAGSGMTVTSTGSNVTNMVVNTRYILTNGASTLTLGLPITATAGQVIEIRSAGANASSRWQITQAASQVVHSVSSSSTTGATGTTTSNERYSCCRIECTVANNEWTVTSLQGTITFA